MNVSGLTDDLLKQAEKVAWYLQEKKLPHTLDDALEFIRKHNLTKVDNAMSSPAREAREEIAHNLMVARAQREAELHGLQTQKLKKDVKENPFWRNVGTTAVALPIGMGLLSAGTYATHKLKEFSNVMGLKDPLAGMAIKRAVDRVVAKEPELKAMDRKLLIERATMIYKNAPDSFLFEPHNVELLANILLKMKSFNGADYTLIHDISKAHKDISSARYGGAGYKDMIGVGKFDL